jgi:hypothetical protein
MSDSLRSTIQKVADRAENRRVLSIVKKTPGALGEPPDLLDSIDRNTVYVSRTETVRMIEREVARHLGNIQKADPAAMQRRVDKWVEGQTRLRKIQSEE